MSYLYNEDIINEVRDKTDIVDVISQYVSLKQLGDNYKGLCPFHSEKTPSFTVSEEKQIFHCFGCSEGGDVFSFLMKHENLDFTEALVNLADKAHVKLEEKKSDTKADEQRKKLYEINREAGIYFYRNLFKDKAALNYLIDRGLDSATLKTFGVGYAHDSWNSLLGFLKDKGYKEVDIEKAGLITHHKKTDRFFDKFRGRIIFPIINTRGLIIGFGGRSTNNQNQPKYLNSPETPVFSKGNNLYGLNIVKKHNKTDKIILVEGYMDVLSLYKFGIVNSVASLGTALTENQVKLLKRYAKEIYICYDSDKAGRSATNKAIEVMKKIETSPKIVLLPDGLDPDDFIKKHGVEKFNDLLDNALTSMDFKIKQKKGEYDITKYEDKINFLKDVSILLRGLKSPVEREVYIEKVSIETDIPSEVIKQEVNRDNVKKDSYNNFKGKKYNSNYSNKQGAVSRENISPVQLVLKPGHVTAERELINLIINNKDAYFRVKGKFSVDDFLSPFYRTLAEIVYSSYEEQETLDIADVLSQFEESEREKVRELFEQRLNIEEDINVVDDYIKNINYHKINMKRESLKKQINELDMKKDKSEEDLEKFNALCLELITIDQSLKIY